LGFTTTPRSVSMYAWTCSSPRALRSRISNCEQKFLTQGQPRRERTFYIKGGTGDIFHNRRFYSTIPDLSRCDAHDQRLVPTSWDQSDGFLITGSTMTIRAYRFQLRVSIQSKGFNVANRWWRFNNDCSCSFYAKKFAR